MKLDLNIGIGQKQGLNLTAQVQQAIKLLQMTNLELTEYIEETFVPNPFVELKDKTSIKKAENSEKKSRFLRNKAMQCKPPECHQ